MLKRKTLSFDIINPNYKKMKKVMLLSAVLVAAIMVSCKETETETTTVESEPVITEEPAPATTPAATDAPATTEEEADGTSVQIGDGGVRVDSKNGENSTNVDVSKDGTAVEVKR